MRQIEVKHGQSDNDIINSINDAELNIIEDLSEKIITLNCNDKLN